MHKGAVGNDKPLSVGNVADVVDGLVVSVFCGGNIEDVITGLLCCSCCMNKEGLVVFQGF